ncbi:class F sortase [Ktedonosporobacter rubrisoli]|uniref:Class F sortase n=1 Tax=Ktedonosporobacter rubrisoli TaxID=2509675 RepID=A0A4P6JPC0_KTERU|nr:class F sortase [Ktedonosporobacter rubrisoli]QBD77218.1 class F sortase [Ktedonosporobacter rubrisoli]
MRKLIWRQPGSFLLWISCLYLISGMATCGLPVERNKPIQPAATKQPHSPVQSTVPAQDIPERLLIPTLKIHAAIEKVGIQATGDLGTPEASPWEDVGWYAKGTIPGQLGSAVIDGHLDRPGGAPAIFWSLHTLFVGNEVIVQMASGGAMQFRVIRVALYTPQAAPVQEIFANTGGAYLNLITCSGDWIPSQQQTTQRIVVYTVLERSSS